LLPVQVSVCAVIQNPNCVWHALVNLTTESKEPKILVKDLQANSNYKLKAAAFNTAGKKDRLRWVRYN